MMSFANTSPKTWTQRLVDWTFGAPKESGRSTFGISNHPQDVPDHGNESTLHLPQAESDTVPVWVEQNARSPLEAFKDAITDGTRQFCEQNVHPLYVLDQRTKFRVTGIQMYVSREKSSFLQVLEKLPIDVRNRMTRILVMGAPGAHDQLLIDDGFFGISLDVEPAVIDGQTIRLIAAWSRDSAEIKLVFSGQYISVEHKPVAPAAVRTEMPVATAAPVPEVAPLPTPVSLTEPLHRTPPAGPSETPLGLPTLAPARGNETNLATPQSRQIALVRVQFAGQEHETSMAITQDMLPFVIGREHTSTGRFQHGISLAEAKDPNLGLLVSREHLEINRFDRDSGVFYLVNHGHSRNGSYHMGSALSERFMLKPQAPNNAIQLGGNGGVGTVRITIEAV
jgi:hypothetical protein